MRKPAPRQRVAAIDMGTNSFHLLIADVLADGSFQVVDRLKEMVALGRDGLHHRLDDDAVERALGALRRIKLLCIHQDVETILACATSAIREAENGGELLRQAHRELRISAHAISGEIEAELVAEAVRHGLSLSLEPSLLVDIGGGSVELVVLDRDRNRFLTSRKLGVARLAAAFRASESLSEVDERRLLSFLGRELADVERAVASEGGITEVIGTSGTVEAVAGMVAARRGDDVRHGYVVEREEVGELFRRLRRMDRRERLEVPGLDYRRADYIVPGLALLDQILHRCGADQLRVCRHGLREGILLRHVRAEAPRLGLLAEFPEPRRRSVMELLRRTGWHQRHGEHVAGLALALFDALAPLHALSAADRELLEFAALLHDIGYHVAHRDHHKHSRYLIRHAELRGFAPEEIEVLAEVARHHRGDEPPRPGRGDGRLSAAAQERVRSLAGFLRVADGLDRSRYQNVERLTVEIKRKRAIVRIETKADPELEIWGGMRRRKLLEELIDRKLEIVAADVREGREDEQTLAEAASA